MNLSPASSKQIAFITTLLADRIVPDTQREAITTAMAQSDVNVHTASLAITALLGYPRKPKAAPAAAKSTADALHSIPKSKYAIRADDVRDIVPEVDMRGNDLLFLEVREYRGTIYMRRLHGSVGDFLRTRLPYATVESLAQFISGDPLVAIRAFGEHFVCCGRCGAPLTTAKSREQYLGPECAKVLGVV